VANDLQAWHDSIKQHWSEIHFGNRAIKRQNGSWDFEVEVYFGAIHPNYVRVEIYAEQVDGEESIRQPINRMEKLPGDANGYVYRGNISTKRSADYLTIRVVPFHEEALVPMEENHILWQH
jgi:starch phosphorylase